MKIYNCQQGSEEWYKIRLGCVTATGFSQVLNKKTGRKTYTMKLLAERMTGVWDEAYHNKFMDDGIEREPFARQQYEITTGDKVQQVGFVKSDEETGVSPDGFVGDDGMIEIKCPLASTHCKYIIDNRLPAVYRPQVQGQLWICGRQWVDFVSYNPYMRAQKLWWVRVGRDEEYIKELAKETKKFLAELRELEKSIVPF
jgi:putative phage-type endonuclease